MEEAELLKERIQAITNKKKIQEEIAHKRLEIDREKLKLQHVKKRSVRDLWLMDGMNSSNAQETQKALEDAQQTKHLKSSIHGIEKEIEALEREEMNISTNEGLILKRLKAIEKSPEDIIKVHFSNMLKPKLNIYIILIQYMHKFHLSLTALFAMEINVQKDLRTGESQVLSTSTISPQELQQKGIKVYDDGRKSVYALRTDTHQPGANGVDELSPVEVEELLRQASEKKKRSNQAQMDPSYPYNLSHELQTATENRESNESNGYQDPYSIDLSAWPELVYNDGVCYPEDAGQGLPLLPIPNYSDRPDEYYHNSRELHRGERHAHGQYYNRRENHRGMRHLDCDITKHSPCSAYSEDSKLSVLNAMPSDEPVTMIFMGYQNAEDDSQSYDGSVRAELVIVGDGEDEASKSFNPHQNCNANNALPYSAGRKGKRDGTEDPSATGTPKIKKVKRRHKHCCVLM
uniref:Palmdelphin n=1 Tax=Cyprinus carpio carpio TaxID=630221 RepID=A0A9J8A2Q6_CYPCA